MQGEKECPYFVTNATWPCIEKTADENKFACKNHNSNQTDRDGFKFFLFFFALTFFVLFFKFLQEKEGSALENCAAAIPRMQPCDKTQVSTGDCRIQP